MSTKQNKYIVAAIDIGTTFSGYAFSFRRDYQTDPIKIYVYEQWNARSSRSSKVPTVVLLDKYKDFLAFGYDAEDTYSDLVCDDLHHGYYYFRTFKMLLHETKHLTRKTLVKDEEGREVPALDIFSMVIKYLKKHLLRTLESRGIRLENNDIHWVLTVPAVWSEPAKQFMREAAEKAGINGDQLSLCLEPVAAFLYCQHSRTVVLGDKQGNGAELNAPGNDTTYMVIDLEVGTVNITCYEKDADGKLRELLKTSGDAWGEAHFDEVFTQLLIKICGAAQFQNFQQENKADALDILREVKTKMHSFRKEVGRKVTLKLPMSLLKTIDLENGENIQDVLKQRGYAEKMTWVGDKLRMTADLFHALFNKPMNHLVNHLKTLLNKKELKDISTLLMVGDISEFLIMQSAIEEAFSTKKIIIPDEAGLAVLKGAVLYGHQPQTISVRVSNYTYGINISPPFKSGEHSPERRVSIEGVDRVQDVFKKYIQAGQSIKIGEEVSFRHVTIQKRQKEMLFSIFASEDSNPRYVTDEGCEYLGKVAVQLPETEEKFEVDVTIIFGETELMVEAKESTTGSTYKSFFDFL